MSRQTSDNSGNPDGNDAKKFNSVTRHLGYQDFKWLKEDMGFFELPEGWDSQFDNNNKKNPEALNI